MKNWLKHWQIPEPAAHATAAILVGLASGAGVWLFKRFIDLAQNLMFTQIGGGLSRLGTWTVILLPVMGGLIVGIIVCFAIGEEPFHGVAGVMAGVTLSGGRLRYTQLPAKGIASAISIGSGASVGPEDPSVQIGANIGSMFGQWLNLSEDRTRALAAAGVASGIAAAFNAPIAGVFFCFWFRLGVTALPGTGFAGGANSNCLYTSDLCFPRLIS
jgi:CIC family chloride channel protein